MHKKVATICAATAIALSACSGSGTRALIPNGSPGQTNATTMAEAFSNMLASSHSGIHTMSISGCPDSTQTSPGIWALGAAQPQYFAVLGTFGTDVNISGPSGVTGITYPGQTQQPYTGQQGQTMAVGVTSGGPPATGSLSISGSSYINAEIRLGTGVTYSNSSSGFVPSQIFQPDDSNLNTAQACALGAAAFWNTASATNFTNYNPTMEQGRLITDPGTGTLTAPDLFYDPNRNPPYIVDYIAYPNGVPATMKRTIVAGSNVHTACDVTPQPFTPCSAVLLVIIGANSGGFLGSATGGWTTSDPLIPDYNVLYNVLNGGTVDFTGGAPAEGIVLAPHSAITFSVGTFRPEVIGGDATHTITITSGAIVNDDDAPLNTLSGTPVPGPTPRPKHKKH